MSTAAAPSAPVQQEKRQIPGFAQMQRVGRSLMLPIAALPAAGLLLRLGQADMLGADGVAGTLSWMQPVADVFAAAGGALFDNLPLIFALGVAIGYARKSDGSTALAALVGYLVFANVLEVLAPSFGTETPGSCADLVAANDLDPADFACASSTYAINYGVLGGIVIGIVAALLFGRYSRIKLPAYLAFFGGRRFVPIVTAFVSVFIAVLFALVYPAFTAVIGGFGDWVAAPGNAVLGGFVFGTVNRLLIPLGLHHLLNAFPWFQFGEFEAAGGEVYAGDIARFIHGDPTAGTFMTGFFPIMMFALPAAALAIWHTARTTRRKVTGGAMMSVALTAFVTGITEPLEFAFAYVAYPLYVVHAVLTGTSLALVNALDIRSGFTFSAGAIDYLLNFRIAERPLLIILIGLGYAVVYYLLFRFAITRWDLRTPGREPDDVDTTASSVLSDQPEDAPGTPRPVTGPPASKPAGGPPGAGRPAGG